MNDSSKGQSPYDKIDKIASETGTGIGCAILFCAIGAFAFFGIKGCQDYNLEAHRIGKGYQMQEADLNGNEIPDKFYNIDGTIAVVELDGKRLGVYDIK